MHCLIKNSKFLDQKNKYPWMVALVSPSGGQFCGGTLVASKYVISAAHCMFSGAAAVANTDFKVELDIFLE